MHLADDQLTARLQFRRTGEAMADGRPPLSASTPRAELQQVRLGGTLSKSCDLQHDPEGPQQLSRSQVLLPIIRSPTRGSHHDLSIFDAAHRLDRHVEADPTHPVVEISPSKAVARLTVSGDGMVAEFVRCTSQSILQHHYRAPMHMLVMYVRGNAAKERRSWKVCRDQHFGTSSGS